MATAKKISPDVVLRISLRPGRDGYVVAECVDVPGCVSQGKDEQEAMENLEDVVRTCFAVILREWMQKAKANRHLPPAQDGQRTENLKLTFERASAVA